MHTRPGEVTHGGDAEANHLRLARVALALLALHLGQLLRVDEQRLEIDVALLERALREIHAVSGRGTGLLALILRVTASPNEQLQRRASRPC